MGIHSWLDSSKLPSAARYFPVEGGIYQVTANLKNLGVDFGNGSADNRVIQLDTSWPEYRQNKLECRAERLGKYFAMRDLTPAVEAAACKKLIEFLVEEYPGHFSWSRGVLHCSLTKEILHFSEYRLDRVEGSEVPAPPYQNGLDALISQIQEDVAIVQRNEAADWLAAIHLCAPGHWAAEQKIGKTFVETHTPVPHIEPITRAARAMVHAMIQKGPFVRFVWGFGSDRRLNHHPEPAPGWDLASWRGRSFYQAPDGEAPFFLRLERQVTYGLPEVDAALFFIRVYYIDGREIRQNEKERETLKMALRTMDADSRRYKGLVESAEPIIDWLDGR